MAGSSRGRPAEGLVEEEEVRVWVTEGARVKGVVWAEVREVVAERGCWGALEGAWGREERGKSEGWRSRMEDLRASQVMSDGWCDT